jgi:carbonic anhydrase
MATETENAALIDQAVWAIIRNLLKHLRYGSDILEMLIHDDVLLIAGAKYSLGSGKVDFFDS